MADNTTGSNNTAAGYEALYSNTTGGINTAAGFGALYSNTTGAANVASGAFALSANTTGADNTASGVDALYANTTGNYNTASGYQALYGDTAGVQNTAVGANALYTNKDGGFNTAVGTGALQKSANGKYNVALGWQAGNALSAGSHNIDIGNQGEAADNNMIRIGTQGTQTKTFLAGVYNVPLSGSAVVVTSTGQLGVSSASSERFKTAIVPMGSHTAKLGDLRPVTFHLRSDPAGPVQYGLIAEEVARVYPELVIHGERGRIDGVRYDELAPMLLNVVQRQAAEIQELKRAAAHSHAQDDEIRQLKRTQAEMQAALQRMTTGN